MTDRITGVQVDKGARRFPQGWPSTCYLCWQPLAILIPLLLFLPGLSGAGVAQLVEHLICNQRVGGSIPSASSTEILRGSEAERILEAKTNGLVSLDTSPFCVFARNACKSLKDKFGTRDSRLKNFSRDGRVSG